MTHAARPDGNALLGLQTEVPGAQMIANMRVNVRRQLPQVTHMLKPHSRTLSIAGGGPSLTDTHQQLGDVVAAVNGSLAYLLNSPDVRREGRHFLCGVCDAGEHIPAMVAADPRVRYYIASCCTPALFDKLIGAGCDVVMWHVSPDSIRDHAQAVLDILNNEIAGDWATIGGGCTMGLRWIDLGYFLGFRSFDLHGLDSSFRNGATHAYPDRADTRNHFEWKGRMTRPNFIAQVHDFFDVMDRFAIQAPDARFRIYGDGLLQDECKPYLATGEGQFFHYRFPAGDTAGPLITMACRQLLDAVLPFCEKRRVAVQAGGNVGVLAKMLARHFTHVTTYEPDPDNMACLLENCPEGNITAVLSAIGATAGELALQRTAGNCGVTHVAESGDVTVPAQRLDDHPDLRDVDLIVLDVEGYELDALQGADALIRRCQPVVVVEENGLAERYGRRLGASLDWLADVHGYGVVGVDGHNYILAPQP